MKVGNNYIQALNQLIPIVIGKLDGLGFYTIML